MIYLYGYQDIKRLVDERRARSLAAYQRRGVDKFPRPAPKLPDAEIIELAFPADCEHGEPIGA